MRPLQWGEHTTYFPTDFIILNVNVCHLFLSFMFITNNTMPLVVSCQFVTLEALV
jgi:hypothetical protein